MGEHTTTDLEQALSASHSVREYLQEHPTVTDTESVSQHLLTLMERQNVQRAELITRSGINDIYVHQILSGKRHPSRDKVLCLAFAMRLNAEDVQTLLKRCGYAPLYAKLRRDSAILHGFYHNLPLLTVNEQLYELGEPLLG